MDVTTLIYESLLLNKGGFRFSPVGGSCEVQQAGRLWITSTALPRWSQLLL
jgi:hypothetical protein